LYLLSSLLARNLTVAAWLDVAWSLHLRRWMYQNIKQNHVIPANAGTHAEQEAN
jgi:hypothetical protein